VISQRLLSEGDIDIHAVTHPSRRTTLMCAARVGNLEVLSLLLARGVDINARTATGETALMIGASFCQSRIVRHLLTFLNSDLALELVDSHGRTASDLALAVRDRVQNSAAHVREAWIAESEQNCALFIAAATWNKSQYLHLKRAITNAVPGLLGPLLKTIISFLGRGIRKG
jgi:ankyrin repeat protein